MKTMKLKTLEKILIAAGLALAVVIIIIVIVCNRAVEVKAPDAIGVLTTTSTTTTTTTTTTTALTYPYEMKLDMTKVKEAHEQNEDVVGWVYVDDTVIDYPIVQYTDNDYYINRDWLGNSSHSGSIFEDFRSVIDGTDNSLLYGHNMGNGSMFHAVKNYKDEAWGKEHMYFEVATLEKRYLYRVVSCNVLNGEDGAAFDYWNRIDLGITKYPSYVQEIRDSATVWYADETDLPHYGDRMITLQTCNSGADDGIRCCLFAQCLGEF